jgi:hypothetical protein
MKAAVLFPGNPVAEPLVGTVVTDNSISKSFSK